MCYLFTQGGGTGSVGCNYALGKVKGAWLCWNNPTTLLCVDCGAGIGRVSKQLLLPIFTKVDLVEQNKTFLDNAPEYLVCLSMYFYL